MVKLTLNPGIDSNLSIVPPVIPSPLPLILTTGIFNAPRIGIATNVTVSPIPPVECLSQTFLSNLNVSPLSINILVKSNVSSKVSPLITIAINNEVIW